MLTILTVTGDRPEVFARCEHYMARQTLRAAEPVEWVVVDDGAEPTPCTMGQKHVKLPAPEQPSAETFNAKIRLALETPGLITGDRVAIIEDDDWYAPHWLAWMNGALETARLAAEIRAVYFHVGLRGLLAHNNTDHASLCMTGFRREIFPRVIELTRRNDRYLDLLIWREIAPTLPRPWVDLHWPEAGRPSVVGIKGIPYKRRGLGDGHAGVDLRYAGDPDLEHLRGWIGDDADFYAPFAWQEATS